MPICWLQDPGFSLPCLPAILRHGASAVSPLAPALVWLAVSCNFPYFFLCFAFIPLPCRHPIACQTDPSVQSVQLVGSWDNFTQSYPMQRDVRRDRGQWRGCYSFRDIVCDDASVSAFETCAGAGAGVGVGAGTGAGTGTGTGTAASFLNKRHGGLKMGHTYYYYYEVDGSVETHDSALPSTTACPYLPGQTVNSLIVPVEQALRQRSASLTSVRATDFKTMDPESKYTTPRPAPSVPSNHPYRVGSSPTLHHKASSRSLSPAPAAWKRLFCRKMGGRDGERGRSPVRNEMAGLPEDVYDRCTTPSEGTRTRDISPESLRRFLSDDLPPRPDSNLGERPSLVIPEDIVEDNDDDDNFATSAASDNQVFVTGLSPPPFRRTASSESVIADATNSSSLTLIPTKPSNQNVRETQEVPASAVVPSRPRLETLSIPGPPFNPATSFFLSPVSPSFPEDEGINFFDMTDDEDDVVSSNNSEILSFQPAGGMLSTADSFECYSLPVPREQGSKVAVTQPTHAKFDSPSLLTRTDSGFAVSGGNFLGAPIDTGLDHFVAELGWMVDGLGSKRN
ncbi:hypothetical protein FZEAL_292 [Fusarium zealandicum]|uniref:Uncharacterized protein n=1 Tax=Fusarium zealandicum TaxID=1053134 RepID=A0A8H4UV73_9HYPO|nr:hypothetical protein FZEAL_292 [Fusarium zealandicum]